MDEQKAVEYLDSLKNRVFMTMNEVDLTNLVLKYKKQLNKAIEYINNHALNFNNEIETDLQVEEVKELVNILKGEDNGKV